MLQLHSYNIYGCFSFTVARTYKICRNTRCKSLNQDHSRAKYYPQSFGAHLYLLLN